MKKYEKELKIIKQSINLEMPGVDIIELANSVFANTKDILIASYWFIQNREAKRPIAFYNIGSILNKIYIPGRNIKGPYDESEEAGELYDYLVDEYNKRRNPKKRRNSEKVQVVGELEEILQINLKELAKDINATSDEIIVAVYWIGKTYPKYEEILNILNNYNIFEISMNDKEQDLYELIEEELLTRKNPKRKRKGKKNPPFAILL